MKWKHGLYVGFISGLDLSVPVYCFINVSVIKCQKSSEIQLMDNVEKSAESLGLINFTIQEEILNMCFNHVKGQTMSLS